MHQFFLSRKVHPQPNSETFSGNVLKTAMILPSYLQHQIFGELKHKLQPNPAHLGFFYSPFCHFCLRDPQQAKIKLYWQYLSGNVLQKVVIGVKYKNYEAFW